MREYPIGEFGRSSRKTAVEFISASLAGSDNEMRMQFWSLPFAKVRTRGIRCLKISVSSLH